MAATAHYVTRLPANAIGDAALRALRAEGVKVEHVVRGGSRLGIYFAETGASQRASTVIYDRAHSAISELQPGSVPWHEVFEGAAWFHCTGITPALSASARECTREALARGEARRRDASASISTTARSCGPSSDAQQTMRPLMPLVDLVIANEEDLQAVLGIEVPHADVTAASLDVGGYRAAAERVAARVRREASGGHAARESVGERQRVERGAVRCTLDAASSRASATRCGSSIASAAATALRRA